MKNCNLFLTLFFFLIFGGSQASVSHREPNPDQNELASSSVKKDTAYLNRLIVEARKYNTDTATIEEARAKIHEAEKLIESAKFETPPLLYIARAELFLTLRDFFRSSEELISYTREVGKKTDLSTSSAYNNILGNYTSEAGFFDISINAFLDNVELAEKNHLKGILPMSYGGLVNVYSAIGNQQEVKNYLELMLEASLKEGDLFNAYKVYMRTGQFLRTEDQAYPEAMASFQEALKYAQKLNDTLKIVAAVNAIASNYYSQNMLDSSFVWFTTMLDYAALIDDLNYLSIANGNIGTIYRDKRVFPEAIEYYQKGIAFALKDRSWSNLTLIYNEISKLYEENSEFEKAYDCQVLYKLYNDSLNRSSLKRDLADARVRYEVKVKEGELQVLSLRIKNQRLFFYGFAGVLLLSVVIGILLVRQWRQNSKRRISEMNRKISEITQANLRQQMNPHFIFNTLNSIQYYMYQNDKLLTNNYLTKFSSLMRKILENSQYTAVALIDEINAVELYLELESIRFKDKFDYSIVLDEEIDTLMYKIPTMLIQPYVENAICHGLIHRKEKGFLSIEIKLKPDHLLCIITDNGIGREAASEIGKLKDNNHQPLGTKITESRIDLINLLYGSSLKTNYCDLKNDEGVAVGTKVEIQIPILT